MTLAEALESALIGQATKADVIAACDAELNGSRPTAGRKETEMRDTCTNCGKWKGLHKWDTMQCPFSEKEDNLFLANQFYAEENAELAALRAERDELREALEEIANGRYGKSVAVKNIARAVLAKYQEAK